jgi:hypothetical protein
MDEECSLKFSLSFAIGTIQKAVNPPVKTLHGTSTSAKDEISAASV